MPTVQGRLKMADHPLTGSQINSGVFMAEIKSSVSQRMDITHWNKFWEVGSATTFGSRFKNGYDGAIRNHWMEFFSGLESGANILDLAAGAGAVVRLASEYSILNSRNFHLSASDLAELPVSLHTLFGQSSIRVFDSTPSTSIPLPPASQDAIVGQFGFEYSDAEATVAEVARLLRKGGKLCAIVHSDDSVIVRDSRSMRRFLTWFVDDLMVIERLSELAILIGDVHCPADIKRLQRRRNVEELRLALNATMEAANRLYPLELSSSVNVQFFNDFFSSKLIGRASERLQHCRDMATQNQAHASRLDDLLAVVVSDEKRKLYDAFFTKHNFFEVDWRPFYDTDQSVLGCLLTAKRH